MTKRYRVQLFWPGRTDSVDTLAEQLADFVGALRRLHRSFAGLALAHPDGSLTPTATALECYEALRASAVDWVTGDTPRQAFRPRLVVDQDVGPPAEFTLTCGIEPLGLGDVFVPNRLEFLLRADAPVAEDPRAAVEAVLRAGVQAFAPAWATAGTEFVPERPLAIFSAGEPLVGWMLYLDKSYPPLPPLAEPAVVYSIDDRGALIVTVPGVFDPDRAEHAAHIEAARAALADARVLRAMV